MTELIICSATALFASLLTLFSGFGLGTILTPVFALFFPIEIAVGLTGVVHLLNNLFKLSLLGKNADRNLVLKFGVPSMFGAFIGASLLIFLSSITFSISYNLFGLALITNPLKIVLGILILFFVLMEIVPALVKLQFSEKSIVAGGLISGFFGGLSGNQGALRSAFLIKLNLEKKVYIATGVVIACIVDLTRLPVYFKNLSDDIMQNNLTLLVSCTLCAFVGAYVGNKLITKITIKTIQTIVSILLIIIAVSLAFGLI
ncbi:MAG: sulfite exporter TauE/SafE family protein [Bacteroidota bacterium]